MGTTPKRYPDCKLCIYRKQLQLPLDHKDHAHIYAEQIQQERDLAEAMQAYQIEKLPEKVHPACPCCTCVRPSTKTCKHCGEQPLSAFQTRMQKASPTSKEKKLYYNWLCRSCMKKYAEDRIAEKKKKNAAG